MNYDIEIFKYLLDRQPNFEKDNDLILMSSIWYVIESFGGTKMSNDSYYIEDSYCCTAKGLINYNVEHYTLQNQYLNGYNFTFKGKEIVESLKEMLMNYKSIKNESLINAVAIVDYMQRYGFIKDEPMNETIKRIAPNFLDLVPQAEETIEYINYKLNNKSELDV